MNSCKYQRERETFSITINERAENVFPLACPYEELKWIDGWSYHLIRSESGRNENNCVFSETMSAPHVMGEAFSGPTVWYTTRYDPEDYIIHFLLVRDSSLTKFEISMSDAGGGSTRVHWDMTITAIRPEANTAFDGGMGERMKLMMAFLGETLKHYCETGTMMVVKGN